MPKYKKLLIPNSLKHHIFLFRTISTNFVGFRRKVSEKSCYSILEKEMLEGELVGYSEGNDKISITVAMPDDPNWREILHYQSVNTDIWFPWPPVDTHGIQFICPESYWDNISIAPKLLDMEEKHFRQHTIKILKDLVFDGIIIYDPACSTGEFISHIQKHYSTSKCIASDRSRNMVELAQEKIPNVFTGDFMNIKHEFQCDIIICRLLNHEIITTESASSMLCKMKDLIRSGGKLVIFGHTPIAIDIPEFSLQNNLIVRSCTGRSYDPDGVFQFYLLEKQL